jgi:hypothetical protein
MTSQHFVLLALGFRERVRVCFPCSNDLSTVLLKLTDHIPTERQLLHYCIEEILFLIGFLLVYSLFNDNVSSSDYIVSNDREM